MVLTVHVGRIVLDPVGFTRFRGGNGALPAWLGGSGVGYQERVVAIQDGRIDWGNGWSLPVAPMLGFVGTSPEHETWANTWAGLHGGNLDVQELTSGAAITLPVNVPGALLHVGDMHARQGDGEICGSGGIEASGVVTLRCSLSPRPPSFSWPRIEDATAQDGRRPGPPRRGRLPRGPRGTHPLARSRRYVPRRRLPLARPGPRSPLHPVRQPDLHLPGQGPP